MLTCILEAEFGYRLAPVLNIVPMNYHIVPMEHLELATEQMLLV
jgi:hypothetical protein